MHAHSVWIVLKEYEPTLRNDIQQIYIHIYIHNYVYEKSAIRLTSVGLTHAHPNKHFVGFAKSAVLEI